MPEIKFAHSHKSAEEHSHICAEYPKPALAGFLLGVFVDIDPKTLLALLTLLAVVVGGGLRVVWARQDALSEELSEASKAFADQRVEMVEKFITSEELDRRLKLSLEPLEKQLDRLEGQGDEVLKMLRDHYKETA